ncbi:hypothetical protein DL765_004092 [Monosporascus sp. GIB2]|nr:hypothetical protein DL765_004092 [Monosporascus sp. GIB2]
MQPDSHAPAYLPYLESVLGLERRYRLVMEQSESGETSGNIVHDLDEGAARIMILLQKLENTVDGIIALTWESDYDRRDLLEDIQSLQRILKDNAILSELGDPPAWPRTETEVELEDPPPRPRTETEVELEWEIHKLETELRKRMSENWELKEQIKDLDEYIWNLEKHLRNDIPVGDIEHTPVRDLKRRTALEKALETKIMELEARIKNPKGRGTPSHAANTGIFSRGGIALSCRGATSASLSRGRGRPSSWTVEIKSGKDGHLEELFPPKAIGSAPSGEDKSPDERSGLLEAMISQEGASRGRPKTPYYEDILLMVVRHSETGEDVLAMFIKFAHHKGADNEPKPLALRLERS